MDSHRIGCRYCFETLNPEDERARYRTFRECLNCGSMYHQVCYELLEKCLHCDQDKSEVIELETVPVLDMQPKESAMLVTPSAVSYSFGELGLPTLGFVVPTSAAELIRSSSSQIERTLSTAFGNQSGELAAFVQQHVKTIAPILLLIIVLFGLCFFIYACSAILP